MNCIKYIDWELLRRQKAWLLEQNHHHANGLVHLIDAIQDEVVESGVRTEVEVFGAEFNTPA